MNPAEMVGAHLLPGVVLRRTRQQRAADHFAAAGDVLRRAELLAALQRFQVRVAAVSGPEGLQDGVQRRLPGGGEGQGALRAPGAAGRERHQHGSHHIGEALAHPQSALHTLRMPHNAVMEEGGLYVVRGLVGNTTLTELDLAHNHLTEACALLLADVARGFYRGGEKVSDSGLKKLVLSGNPSIGVKAAKLLVRSLANERVRHLELANIGARAGASRPLAHGLRDPAVAWQYLDVADNWFGRAGLNQMFWALRQNKRLRVLKVGENRTGTKFCSNEDALLKHGIAVVRALACNVVLRELDLSFSSITTDGGINLLDALIDNRTLKRLSLRGNLVDDNIALMLMLRSGGAGPGPQPPGLQLRLLAGGEPGDEPQPQDAAAGLQPVRGRGQRHARRLLQVAYAELHTGGAGAGRQSPGVRLGRAAGGDRGQEPHADTALAEGQPAGREGRQGTAEGLSTLKCP
mmetsp:Transcript_18452/g.25468  ORF Transcript_18452/g.25468 Transcript_18452/m.25468 type:complete len:462 (+) Transcript_18452:1112-2497(+)